MAIVSRHEAFDSFALEYDQFRPVYPQAAINRLLSRVSLKSGSKILEIGCGSGQATRAFVEKGLDVTAVDPGHSLLEIAARKLPDVSFVVAKFEDFVPKETPPCFDFALSETAFHWVDQMVVVGAEFKGSTFRGLAGTGSTRVEMI